MKGFDSTITIYPSLTATEGKPSTLRAFLFDTDHRAEVERIRAAQSEQEQKALKKAMPAAAISGEFPKGRKAANGFRHSGLLCVDVDAKENPGIPPGVMKAAIAGCRETMYCALSVRGQGVFAILKLLWPERHKSHFKAVERVFRDRLGLTIDRGCSDVGRLRVWSYDPNPYVNENSAVFCLLDDEAAGWESAGGQPSPTGGRAHASAPDNEGSVLRDVERYVAEVERQGIDLAPSREEWVKLGFALHSLGGCHGYGFFRRLSALWRAPEGKATTEKALAAFWKSATQDARAGAITIRTFFDMCHRAGVAPRGEGWGGGPFF